MMSKEFFIQRLEFNGWEMLTYTNKEEAIDFIQDVSNTIKKELWYEEDKEGLFNVFLKRGLRDNYKDIKDEYDSCELTLRFTFEEYIKEFESIKPMNAK